MARRSVDWTAASEAALILASQARDETAFAELVKRRQGWVRALLRRLCAGNHAEADDLSQEAFVKAWRRIGDLAAPAAFPGWFRRIAVTTFLMSRRGLKGVHEPFEDGLTAADEASLPDSAAGARIDLDRALQALSDAERLCVTLNLGEGLSHAQIVELTSLPLGTVKSHVTRGTQKIRRALRPEAST